MTKFNVNGTEIEIDLTVGQMQMAANQIIKDYSVPKTKPVHDYLCLDKDDVTRLMRYCQELSNPTEMPYEKRQDISILIETILNQAQRLNQENIC